MWNISLQKHFTLGIESVKSRANKTTWICLKSFHESNPKLFFTRIVDLVIATSQAKLVFRIYEI